MSTKSSADQRVLIALAVMAAVGYGAYWGGNHFQQTFQTLPVKGAEREQAPSTNVNELKSLYPVVAESNRIKENLENRAVDEAFRLPPSVSTNEEKARQEKENREKEKKEVKRPSPLQKLPHVLWVEAISNDGAFIMGRFWQQGDQITVPGLPFEPTLAEVRHDRVVLSHEGDTVFLHWRDN